VATDDNITSLASQTRIPNYLEALGSAIKVP